MTNISAACDFGSFYKYTEGGNFDDIKLKTI